MPVKTNWKLPILHWECIDIVHNEEFMTCLDQMNTDARYRKIKYEIFDCSQCKKLYMTTDETLFYAGHDVGRIANGESIKVALVTNGTTELTNILQSYKSRMDEYCSEAWEVEIFTSLKDSLGWIQKFES